MQLDDNIFQDFPTYNREWERYKASLNEKEDQWESELNELMEKSADLKESPKITTSNNEDIPSFHSSPKRLESKLEKNSNEVGSASKSDPSPAVVPSVASSNPQNNELKCN